MTTPLTVTSPAEAAVRQTLDPIQPNAWNARLADLPAGTAIWKHKPTDFQQLARGIAQAQANSDSMQKAFVMGDERVSLSDTMIAMQKASVNFQAAVQVRNKVVQAYNDIMNMQV